MSTQNAEFIKMKTIYLLIILWASIWHNQLSHAIREGTTNAKVMIRRYEQAGDFAKAALWHEAAADCLKTISVPIAEIQIRYHLRHGKNVLAERGRGELVDIQERWKHHQEAARTHWEKSETEGTSPELEVEREKITQFVSTWVQIYPNRFYRYGIYPSFFKVEQEIFKRREDYAAALNLEADAAEMCADQYDEITVAYFQQVALNCNIVEKEVRRGAISDRGKNCPSEVAGNCVAQYEKVRDAHRQRAALLRGFADGKSKTLPPKAEAVLRNLPYQVISPAPKLTPAQVLRIANKDAHLQKHLTPHTGVHGYASFQGFAWFVSYHNHGWGNLGIVLVDDKTGIVLDVLYLLPTRN